MFSFVFAKKIVCVTLSDGSFRFLLPGKGDCIHALGACGRIHSVFFAGQVYECCWQTCAFQFYFALLLSWFCACWWQMWASRVEISPFKDGLPAYLSYLPEQDDEEDDVEDVEEDQVEAEWTMMMSCNTLCGTSENAFRRRIRSQGVQKMFETWASGFKNSGRTRIRIRSQGVKYRSRVWESESRAFWSKDDGFDCFRFTKKKMLSISWPCFKTVRKRIRS